MLCASFRIAQSEAILIDTQHMILWRNSTFDPLEEYQPCFSYNYVKCKLVLFVHGDIRITCPCVLYPHTPHFYIVKLGFTGVYIIFLFLLLNIFLGTR